MSCGVGGRCGSDLMLLCLWGRPAAIALVWSLAWKLPYAMAVALKRQKEQECFMDSKDATTLKGLVYRSLGELWGCIYPFIFHVIRCIHKVYMSKIWVFLQRNPMASVSLKRWQPQNCRGQGCDSSIGFLGLSKVSDLDSQIRIWDFLCKRQHLCTYHNRGVQTFHTFSGTLIIKLMIFFN